MRLPLLVSSLLALAGSADAAAPDLRAAIRAALDVSEFTLQSLDVPDAPVADDAIRVDLAGREAWLVLEPTTVRADAFRLMIDDGSGPIEVAPPPRATWKGDVLFPTSSAFVSGTFRASVRDGGLRALVRLDDGTTHGIQPLTDVDPGATRGAHVVFDAADTHELGGTCGLDALEVRSGDEVTASIPGGPQFVATGLNVCEIAIEADFPFYGQNGSDVAATVYDVENVMNAVSGIYEPDVGLTFEVTSILVRTSSDPYTTSNSGGLLDQFRAEWINNQTAHKRDVAHLFTGRNLSGSVIGVAWLSSICNGLAYGLSQSKFTGNFAARTGLTAHELGHNWGSDHCSGSDCRIMCPGIGGCSGDVSKFGQFAKNSILSYKATKTLCATPLPDPLALGFFDDFPATSVDSATWTHVKKALSVVSGDNEPSPPYSLQLRSFGAGAFDQAEIRTNFILAAGAPSVVVRYSTEHIRAEAGDELVVDFRDANLTWVEVTRHTSDGIDQTQFDEHVLVLPPAAAHDGLRLRFRVEGDDVNDAWYVDDVFVGTCGGVEAYGAGELGSTGQVATIGVGPGLPAVGGNLTLTLTGGNPNSFTVLFAGQSEGSNVQPWGTILVAGPDFTRTITSTDASGAASVAFPLLPAMANLTYHFQYAVRDPGFGGNIQASGGVRVTVCP